MIKIETKQKRKRTNERTTSLGFCEDEKKLFEQIKVTNQLPIKH